MRRRGCVHLREAYPLIADPEDRARAAYVLVNTALFVDPGRRSRSPAARWRSSRRARGPAAGPARPRGRLRVLGAGDPAIGAGSGRRRRGGGRLRRARPGGDRRHLPRGRRPGRAGDGELAARALADGHLLREDSGLFWVAAVNALGAADGSRRRSTSRGRARTPTARARSSRRYGPPVGGGADATPATSARPDLLAQGHGEIALWTGEAAHTIGYTLGMLGTALVGQGELAEAERVLAQGGPALSRSDGENFLREGASCSGSPRGRSRRRSASRRSRRVGRAGRKPGLVPWRTRGGLPAGARTGRRGASARRGGARVRAPLGDHRIVGRASRSSAARGEGSRGSRPAELPRALRRRASTRPARSPPRGGAPPRAPAVTRGSRCAARSSSPKSCGARPLLAETPGWNPRRRVRPRITALSGPRLAHPSGTPRRRPRRGGTHEPRHRPDALRHAENGRGPPLERLPQARRRLPSRSRLGAGAGDVGRPARPARLGARAAGRRPEGVDMLVASTGKGASVSDPELKARHRSMWASGDYPSMVETFLLPLGPRLVEACAIEPGMRVLDVAAGTGNASLPAAGAGAHVVASDLTPELLEAGRRRAEAAGLSSSGSRPTPSSCRSRTSPSTSSCPRSARCSRPTTRPSPTSSCACAVRAARSVC